MPDESSTASCALNALNLRRGQALKAQARGEAATFIDLGMGKPVGRPAASFVAK